MADAANTVAAANNRIELVNMAVLQAVTKLPSLGRFAVLYCRWQLL
jgi:hypothetical protein